MDLLAPWSDRGRLSFKETNYTFGQDKAYYTHFLIKGNKFAFILTPTGGMWGVGIGFHRATFSIHTMDGARIAAGRYLFPEDSLVLFDDEKSIVFLMNSDGDFEIKEILLKGL